MNKAAKSPVGLNPVTLSTKVRDIFIVVVMPFTIPALVLPMANGWSSFTLTNLAFGFVAVAAAGVARAVTSKRDEWLTYVVIAFLCVSLQTGLAVAKDTSEPSANLKRVVLRETNQPGSSQIPAIRDAAREVADAEAGLFHWACSSFVGAVLILLSLELIRRER